MLAPDLVKYAGLSRLSENIPRGEIAGVSLSFSPEVWPLSLLSLQTCKWKKEKLADCWNLTEFWDIKKSKGRKKTEQIEALRKRLGSVQIETRRVQNQHHTEVSACVFQECRNTAICVFALLLCLCPSDQELNAWGKLSSLVARDGSNPILSDDDFFGAIIPIRKCGAIPGSWDL